MVEAELLDHSGEHGIPTVIFRRRRLVGYQPGAIHRPGALEFRYELGDPAQGLVVVADDETASDLGRCLADRLERPSRHSRDQQNTKHGDAALELAGGLEPQPAVYKTGADRPRGAGGAVLAAQVGRVVQRVRSREPELRLVE
jgi:hypothetical protein